MVEIRKAKCCFYCKFIKPMSVRDSLPPKCENKETESVDKDSPYKTTRKWLVCDNFKAKGE